MRTTKGDIAEELLEKKEFITDNDHERTIATEYRLEGELVRRDAHVTLKETISLDGTIEQF